jgi:hypothetical protein
MWSKAGAVEKPVQPKLRTVAEMKPCPLLPAALKDAMSLRAVGVSDLSHHSPRTYSTLRDTLKTRRVTTRGIIYLIRNTITEDTYVGGTKTSLEKRWKRHRECARKDIKSPLFEAIRVYGPDAFIIYPIITVLDYFNLAELEVIAIDQWKPTYNRAKPDQRSYHPNPPGYRKLRKLAEKRSRELKHKEKERAKELDMSDVFTEEGLEIKGPW